MVAHFIINTCMSYIPVNPNVLYFENIELRDLDSKAGREKYGVHMRMAEIL